MAPIKFKVAAKTDVGIVRTNNEDNFQISWDLSSLPMRWINNEIHQLGKKGCLLVVADGMGGANAGEVASQIAIDTIKNKFSPDEITDKIVSSIDAINGFIKEAIVSADSNIKQYAVEHPETKGMGTTIVVAWIINDKLYIGWCGDSRAYLYNPAYGLLRITKDHSYVQQLVDSGKLSEDDAFDFPDSNIITQCLSASPQKCRPETISKPISLSNEDTVLLCTDGLCGMIRDSEINAILKESDEDLTKTADSLVSGAIDASGADNVTLCLFNVVSGLKKATPIKPQVVKCRKKLYVLLAAVVAVLIAVVLWLVLGSKDPDQSVPASVIQESITIDSIPENTSDSTKTESEVVDNKVSENATSEDVKGQIEQKIGNGNNLLQGLKTSQVPKTEEKPSSEDNQEVEILSTPEVIAVKIPSNKSLRAFLREFNMNQTDFKKLNPEVDDKKLQAGDEIKVYKKK